MKSLVLAIAAAALIGALEHHGKANSGAFAQAFAPSAADSITPQR